jgi:hypothetical protein
VSTGSRFEDACVPIGGLEEGGKASCLAGQVTIFNLLRRTCSPTSRLPTCGECLPELGSDPGENLQLPFHGKGSWQIANRRFASLILKFSRDRRTQVPAH